MFNSDIFNTTESEFNLPNLTNFKPNKTISNTASNLENYNALSATSNYTGSLDKYNTMSETSAMSGNSIKPFNTSVMIGGNKFQSASVTSSMIGGNSMQQFSATSATLVGGNGSSKNNQANYVNDINKLLSMLTSETEHNTTTQQLENQLSNILKKDKSNSQNGGTINPSVGQIKGFFNNLKSQGIDVNVKLNDQTMSEFFNNAENTTTELHNNIFINEKQQTGGQKSSKKKSKKGSKKESMDGGKGSNPGFTSFFELRTHIATNLNIPNGKDAIKIASAVRKDVQKIHPNDDAVTLCKKAIKHFDSNKEKYKKLK